MDVTTTPTTEEVAVSDTVAPKQTPEQLFDNDPAEMSLRIFLQLYPNFKRKVESCNRKDLCRLIEGIVGWPLAVSNMPKFYAQEAKDAWQIGSGLMQARQVMIMNVQLANSEAVAAEVTPAPKKARKTKTKEIV